MDSVKTKLRVNKLRELAAKLPWPALFGTRASAAPPPRAQVGAPLDAINDQFHEAYGDARAEVEDEAPVVVVLADELVLLRRGERSLHPFTPRTFHVVKSLSHAPLAIYIEHERLLRAAKGQLDEAARVRLVRQRERIEASKSYVTGELAELEPRSVTDLRALLDACERFLERYGAQPSRAALTRFAGELGPVLMRLIDDATALQLTALDRVARSLLGQLSAPELAQLQVVVTGDHQARVRSLPMQYFLRLLGERDGSERRVVYAEGVQDEQGALALAATRRLDRAIGRDFFGEPRRLQRDLLGDAAHAQLEAAAIEPLDDSP